MRDHIRPVRRFLATGTAALAGIALWRPVVGPTLLESFPVLLLGCFSVALVIAGFTSTLAVRGMAGIAGMTGLVGSIGTGLGATGWVVVALLIAMGLALIVTVLPGKTQGWAGPGPD